MGETPKTGFNPISDNDSEYLRFSSKYFYLYYIKHNEKSETRDSDSEIECYFIKRRERILWDDIEREVRDIIDEIRDGTIRPNRSHPKGQEWKHRSYFVVLIEGIRKFISGNPITVTGPHAGPFRNGAIFPLDDMYLSGFVCLNHLKNKDGDVLQGNNDDEEFKIAVNHNKTHEISGTNMGPPIGGG